MADMVNSTAAERLRVLRTALGFRTQQEMVDFLGVPFNRYNNVERGHPLSHDLAIRICQKVPGMTLDWLHFGKAGGLTLDIANRIGGPPAAPGRPSRGRRPTRS